MIKLKTPHEINLIAESADLLSRTLGEVAKNIKAGVTELTLDKIARQYIENNGAKPAFLGLNGFPNTLCISKNHKVVHGIPNEDRLQEGDIVSIDCGVSKNGFFSDQAYTFEVGKVDEDIKKLVETTKKSLYVGIDRFKLGNSINDIGKAIQEFIKPYKYGLIKSLVGHGIGRSVHEEPQVPNYNAKDLPKIEIREGMVIAIEPMINMKSPNVILMNDNWTIISKDKLPSAHFEHTVALVDGSPKILTTFDYIQENI